WQSFRISLHGQADGDAVDAAHKGASLSLPSEQKPECRRRAGVNLQLCEFKIGWRIPSPRRLLPARP
ncbi:hypothetical protein J7L18_05705, partial [Candidatus Bathyarchaeota archaeon]|nr:hypothetical protein [Candidatus Bathyarchaeota archaeon]